MTFIFGSAALVLAAVLVGLLGVLGVLPISVVVGVSWLLGAASYRLSAGPSAHHVLARKTS